MQNLYHVPFSPFGYFIKHASLRERLQIALLAEGDRSGQRPGQRDGAGHYFSLTE